MDTCQVFRFVITGGGGFIGFHIGLRLLQLNHEVILYDINYPSAKWDAKLQISHDDDDLFKEGTCSFGKLKFVKGTLNLEQDSFNIQFIFYFFFRRCEE